MPIFQVLWCREIMFAKKGVSGMYCLKCGNETLDEKIFCEDCLLLAQRYPIKPGTPIQLPRHDQQKKNLSQKRTIGPEEQVEALRKALRRTRVLLFLMAIALAMALGIVFNII